MHVTYVTSEKFHDPEFRRPRSHNSALNDLLDPRGRRNTNGHAHDRTLLEDWFRKSFAPGPSPD